MARILLIDDDGDVRELLTQMLETASHVVIPGGVGSALLEDLQNAEYDLVITDLQMPVLDGWDVAAWLRDRRPGVPIIAIGGDVSERRNAPKSLFDGVLAKPFKRAPLLRLVASLIPVDR